MIPKLSVGQIITLIVLILSGCNVERDVFTGFDINPEMINSHIYLGELSSTNEYFNNQPSVIHLENISNGTITFSGDYSLHIYKNSEMGWVEIDNHAYYSIDQLTLFAISVDPVGFLIVIVPYIPGLEEATEIRVVVHGTDTSSNEEVAAYIDLTLQP